MEESRLRCLSVKMYKSINNINLISANSIDINKTVLSKKVPLGKQSFKQGRRNGFRSGGAMEH